MKRLLMLSLVAMMAPSPAYALGEPNPQMALRSEALAFPLLPSKSLILGGDVDCSKDSRPNYVPSPDFSDGTIGLGYNCLSAVDTDKFIIRTNPSWDNGNIQNALFCSNRQDGSYFFINPKAGIRTYEKYGCFTQIKTTEKPGYFVVGAYNFEFKKIIELEVKSEISPVFYPLTSTCFLLESDSKSVIIDSSGLVIVEGKRIEKTSDLFERFILADGKLYELSKKSFAPVEFPSELLNLRLNFLSDKLEIVEKTPPPNDYTKKARVWRYSYAWELLGQLVIDYPAVADNPEFFGIFGDRILFFNNSSRWEKTGFYVYDFNRLETMIFLPCAGFEMQAKRARLNGSRLFIPNADGAWILDVGTLKLETKYFPSKTSIIETERGYFAIGFDSGQSGMVLGYLLDPDLKPLDSTKTLLPKSDSYIAVDKRILSLSSTTEPVYDYLRKTNINYIYLSLWCTIVGEQQPKKVGYYRIKSQYDMPRNLSSSVFGGKLYIRVGVADYYAIDLTTYKTLSFWNDEMTVKYWKDYPSPPTCLVSEMMTAFFHKDSRLFVYDKWKNLRIDCDVRAMSGNVTENVWIWWDKIIIGYSKHTTIIQLDGSSQHFEGRVVNFRKGILQMMMFDSSQNPDKLINFDVDTKYQRTVWSIPPKIGRSFSVNTCGSSFIVDGGFVCPEGNLMQTGITNLNTWGVDDGCIYMSPARPEEKGSGNDSHLVKWTPAPTYAIRRSYKNEFVLTATRGDGRSPYLSGKLYICRWGVEGKLPQISKLSEVVDLPKLEYGASSRFRIRIPQSKSFIGQEEDRQTFALIFVGNGLLDTGSSILEKIDYSNRAAFDGTPIDALNQQAVSVTVWQEEP